MENVHPLNDAEKVFVERLGTADEVMQKISAAESKGDYVLAYNIAYGADYYGIVDLSKKKEDLENRIFALQKELLDSNPVGEMVISEDWLVKSACCEELKKAILDKNVGVGVYDCMTQEPCLMIEGPELMSKAFDESEDKYADDDLGQVSNCPFCGKEIPQYFVKFSEV